MKHGPIMPEVPAVGRLEVGEICFVPLDVRCPISKSSFRKFQSPVRYVQDGEVLKTLLKKDRDEKGGATSDIDEPGLPGQTGVSDQG
jgi:hypothetical protein